MADKFIGVRVPAELKKRLQAEATEKGVSLSATLRAYLETKWASSPEPKPVEVDTSKVPGMTASFQIARPPLDSNALRTKAKALVLSKNLPYRAAYAQAVREEAETE